MKKLILIILFVVGVRAHEVTLRNFTSTNKELSLGDWTFNLPQGGQLRLPDIPTNAVIVCSNSGWSFDLSSTLAEDSQVKVDMLVALSNGVEIVTISPSFGPAKWIKTGMYIAFTIIGFSIAMRLAGILRSPLKEGE